MNSKLRRTKNGKVDLYFISPAGLKFEKIRYLKGGISENPESLLTYLNVCRVSNPELVLLDFGFDLGGNVCHGRRLPEGAGVPSEDVELVDDAVGSQGQDLACRSPRHLDVLGAG